MKKIFRLFICLKKKTFSFIRNKIIITPKSINKKINYLFHLIFIMIDDNLSNKENKSPIDITNSLNQVEKNKLPYF